MPSSFNICGISESSRCAISVFLSEGDDHTIRISHPDGWSVLLGVACRDRGMGVSISEPTSYGREANRVELTYTDPVNFEGLHPPAETCE
jgi:hypothetical protein